MARKVFVSYSHEDQGAWVRGRLVPCLRSGGAEVFVDYETFGPGKRVIGMMDQLQDAADSTILVLSPKYFLSPYCLHEMRRAIARDPDFEHGLVLPIVRERCGSPDPFAGKEPLHVNLEDDESAEQWDLLLKGCEADLGMDAPSWFKVGDEIQRYLDRRESVNLTTPPGSGTCWSGILQHLIRLPVVDLQNPKTRKTLDLVRAICRALGVAEPRGPDALDDLNELFSRRELTCLALTHFDMARSRHYPLDLFNTFRFHIMETRKLVVLIQSQRSFAELLPTSNPMSEIQLQTVELQCRR